jgi:transcriptional regulator with XRE-family HTH domain
VLSETLSEGLSAYGVGEKVRRLRLRKAMGLVELGTHTGLSPALLSKIERGRIFPTLPTLLRISLVFSVGLEHFFAPDADQPLVAVVRRHERQRFPEAPDVEDGAYTFESLDFRANDRKLNAYYAEFRPSESGKIRRHDHAGAEFIYVIRGELAVAFPHEEVILAEGDSVYFDSSQPHGYHRAGEKTCSALVVTVA